MTEGAAPITCLPLPLDASTFIAEHVLVIMTGFAEQSNVGFHVVYLKNAHKPLYNDNVLVLKIVL